MSRHGRAPSPPACGPFLSGLFSHRLWLLGLLLLASSVLVGCGGEDMFSAWSPDGTKIAFTSDRDGNFEIYVMNADGTNPTRLH